MTDSMKFGPEWLRNMSADNTNTNLLSGAGNNGSGTPLSNSGNAKTSSSSLNNSGNRGCHHLTVGITSNVSSTIVPSSYALTPRNTFPEFRYGREEMLSLFDKNYNMPDILPTFKKIFVEKAQLPLALTPSTDEDFLPQVSPVATQRPSWLQRSPIGFSTRGTGRGGSVDRGRIRGKPNYHQNYQRPSVMCGDDDSRPVPFKADRNWLERNGAGDSLSAAGSNIGGMSSDWNGTTISSPRKEFSSHPRNMENWRRNRKEDGAGDASTSSLGNTEGWRGSSSGSVLGSHRWGRSTSWRDEETSSVNAADVTFGSANVSVMAMQRSYSNITSLSERGGYGSANLTKTPPNGSYCVSGNQGSNRTFNSLSGLNSASMRTAQWNAINSDVSLNGGGESEDILPEWAMETPCEGGGTFDASGAFHGSVDENESASSGKLCREKSLSSCESFIRNKNVSSVKKWKSSETPNRRIPVSLKNFHKKNTKSDTCENSNLFTPVPKPVHLPKENASESSVQISSEVPKAGCLEDTVEGESNSSKIVLSQKENEPGLSSADIAPCCNSSGSSMSKPRPATTDSTNNVHRDLSDRMQEVADDMIEKLIMDDDTISINDNNARDDIKSEQSVPPTQVTISTTISAKDLCSANVFTTVNSILKQPQHQAIQGPASVSPTMKAPLMDGGIQKNIQLYGGGIVADHATIQHHHLRQQQLVAATLVNDTSGVHLPHGIDSTTSTIIPTDLWYYRDPQSKVQGPFTAVEMTEWYRAGYFNENLYVRRLCDTHFRSLGDLIKLCNDNMPFTHSHLIPNLGNTHLPNSVGGSAAQPQTPQIVVDYSLKPQSALQNEQQRDQGNLSSGNEFLASNAKNVIIPVDVSNMYFQMLRHQELLIYNELSENECFQQLTASEKEAVVRQKLQMYSEYLLHFSSLSNSLTPFNPTAAPIQLYDVMLDGSKTDRSFLGITNTPQQPQLNPFLEHDNFLRNPQQHQQPLQTYTSSPFGNVLPPGCGNSEKLDRLNDNQTENQILSNFNMRLYLPSENGIPPLISNPKDFIGGLNADFLNDAQLLVARTSLVQNNSLTHTWLPPLANRALEPVNNWPNNSFVGIPPAVMQGPESTTDDIKNLAHEISQQQQDLQAQNPTPISMWNIPTFGHIQGEPVMLGECNSAIFENQNSQISQSKLSLEEPEGVTVGQNNQSKFLDDIAGKKPDTTIQNHELNAPIGIFPTTSITQKKHKVETIDKNQYIHGKRITKQSTSSKHAKGCDDSSNNNKTEGEKRRDQAEDKRRQKEEKKRQQGDGEKRRQQQTDEEKRRHTLEEKERQQQIQAQRRKAMLRTKANTNNMSTNIAGRATCSPKPIKEQQCIQSSIAPWSAQTNTSAQSGPCLAEIQKAERRERQMEQRQMEMFVKRVRASAAVAVEAFDSMLKWNAPLKEVPVKSFAEIQAEEAKRLASEQTEIQRRKEQEQHQSAAAMGTASGPGLSSNKMSAIWSGTKVWGSTSTTGFWEEPIKFSASVAARKNVHSTAASSNGNSTGNINSTNSKQTALCQQNLPVANIASTAAVTTGVQNANQNQNVGARSLRKSQTVPAMHNAEMQNGKGAQISTQQHHSNTAKQGPGIKIQKSGSNNGDCNAATDKKGILKIQYNVSSVGGISTNKRDDYENEFIAWCTKSLNNMNTQLDVPTFVTFLRDLESPYEVKDYIRMYIGENKECMDFSKQFLERRSKYKNLQRAQNAHNDDMCKPAPAITPVNTDNSDSKGKQRKLKKNKMTKLDARILGFSVTSAEGRTNVGDRVYVDTP